MEPQAHPSGPHAEDHGYRVYGTTWFWLLIITIAEVGITFLHIPRVLMVLGLVGMAIAKAVLIMAYFMHLKFERRTLTYMIGLPMILIVVLYFALWPDALLLF
ncbi:MAG: cytochrome C oxidase subunit IV family protein [Armatimonadota bacterium]|nr:cytochrome C oxidase subunit IV family protein [Armatimonadota bacterium]MDR5697676.1 cytochrome C oxidase subunit IV family protein [Armatimonadota bacterium]